MSDETQKFVIFTAARSGSTAIVSTLSGHPDVHCWGHPFFAAENKTRNISTLDKSVFDISEYNDKPVEFVQSLLAHPFKGKKMQGMKLWPMGPDEAPTTAACEAVGGDESIKKVILRRHNELAGFSSWMLVREKRLVTKAIEEQGDAYEGPQLDEIKGVAFKEGAFRKFVERRFKWFADRDAMIKGPKLEIGYEGLMSTGIPEVAKFLELDPSYSFEQKTKKRGTGNIIDRFIESDREKVQACLKDLGHPEWIAENA